MLCDQAAAITDLTQSCYTSACKLMNLFALIQQFSAQTISLLNKDLEDISNFAMFKLS